MEPRAYCNLSPKRGWSWETPPAKIPENQIAETIEADVAIVGGGLSGLAAGARCAQMGLRVAVADKSGRPAAHGTLIGALDSPVMRENGVSIDKKQFARDWVSVSGSRVNEDLLRLFMDRSGEALEWLLSLAGSGVTATLHSGYKGPDFSEYPGAHQLHKKPDCAEFENSSGGPLVGEILEKTLVKNGGRVFRSIRAEQLEKDGAGRVVSFIARGADGKYRRFRGNKAVILASGTIGADAEMLEAFCPEALRPEKNMSLSAGLATGDGHKMAYWAGAAFDDLPWAPAFSNSAFCPYSFFFLHVNQRGQRFMNEDTWEQAKAIRCLMQPGGDYAFTVMDGKWLRDYGERFDLIGGRGVVPPALSRYGAAWDSGRGLEKEIETAISGGFCKKADSLDALASMIGIPSDALKKTVRRYNELAASGEDVDFGKRGELLTTVSEPSFYALKWGPVLLDVFGGALTDTRLNVLGPGCKPIPGLYAVGKIAGGMYGVDYPGLLGGISCGRALTWALAVADGIRADGCPAGRH